MKMKKHYEPGQLAAWLTRLHKRAAEIEAGLRAAKIEDADVKALRLARDDPAIEAARQQIRVTHVEVIHTGKSEFQTWSAKHLAEWAEHGWARIDGGQIILTTSDHQPDLVYDILRSPGYYCASTGERIPLSDLAMSQYMTKTVATLAPREAKAWLLAHGKAADDYEATRNYVCELRADQQAQFSAVKEA